MALVLDVFSDTDIQAAESQATLVTTTLADLPPSAGPVQPGVAPDCFSIELTNEAYHDCKNFISHTGMIKILRSPAHYLSYLAKQSSDEVEKVNVFSAFHAAVLEPERFSREYVTYKGRRQGKVWDEFAAANAASTILNESEMARAHGVVNAIKTFDELPLGALLKASETEKSIFWFDHELGVNLRVRVDALNQNVILDLKGIDDARPDKVARQAAQMEYDLQAALYTRAVRAFTGKQLPFVFMFVEDKEPFGVWVYTAGASLLANGERKLRRAAAAFKRLQETGDWHGYKNASTVLELPRWAMLEPDLDDAMA